MEPWVFDDSYHHFWLFEEKQVKIKVLLRVTHALLVCQKADSISVLRVVDGDLEWQRVVHCEADTFAAVIDQEESLDGGAPGLTRTRREI